MLDYRSFLNSNSTKKLLNMPRKPRNLMNTILRNSENSGDNSIDSSNGMMETSTGSSSSTVSKQKLGVIWMAPFFSGGGYCSEATAFVTGLDGVSDYDISINQHGDGMNTKYMFGLSNEQYQYLQYIANKDVSDRSKVISICHSEPGAWQISRTLPMRYSTSICPTTGSVYSIGRTMFESDRLPNGWSERLSAMDEIWVPTGFMKDIVTKAGVDSNKILVLPEPIDTEFFNPLPFQQADDAANPAPNYFTSRDCGSKTSPVRKGSTAACPLRFLSIGKWERRKGFDILLRAYLTAFDASKNDYVELYILTSAYHSTSDFTTAIEKMIKNELTCGTTGNQKIYNSTRAVCIPSTKVGNNNKALPVIKLLTEIPQADMASIYAAVDAVVQPSRGEGWGRPHVEAMAMGLPLIATFWSGPSEFMTETNSFPLRHTALLPIPDGAFAGHLQAEPDPAHLAELMLYVYKHPNEAAQKGVLARQDMINYYEPLKLALFLNAHFHRINDVVVRAEQENLVRQEESERLLQEILENQEKQLELTRQQAEAEIQEAEEKLRIAREEAAQRVAAAIEEMERPRREAEQKAREEEEAARAKREQEAKDKEEAVRRKREEARKAAEESTAQHAAKLQAEKEEKEMKRKEAARTDTDLDFGDLAAYAKLASEAVPTAGETETTKTTGTNPTGSSASSTINTNNGNKGGSVPPPPSSSKEL